MMRIFITFRSVTPAQRGQRILQSNGIGCALQRTPRYMQDRGCGYCLRLRPADALNGVEALRRNGVSFSKVYAQDNGSTEELQL